MCISAEGVTAKDQEFHGYPKMMASPPTRLTEIRVLFSALLRETTGY